MTTKKLMAYGLSQNPSEGIVLALQFDDGDVLVTMPREMAHHLSNKLIESVGRLTQELQEARTTDLHRQVKDDQR